MTAVNLNSFPYFDDYESTKGYHKIAFIPGRPIQARELTQMQSILQEQVKRVGRHFFKNGTVILPGHTYYDNKVFAIRLGVTNSVGVNIDAIVLSLIGATVSNATGTKAFVKHATVSSETSPAILYVSFTSGGATGILEFLASDTLTDDANVGNFVSVTNIFVPTSKAAIVTIAEGVYYANGYFVQVLRQTIALSDNSNQPSALVGLSVNESVVTEAEDPSLYDNSVGSPNYSSPGAHRVQISLVLSKQDFSTSLSTVNSDRVDFIALYNILNGEIQYEKGQDTEYDKFESLLAVRTFEESGNYISEKFDIGVLDYRDNNRDSWAANTPYLEGDIVSVNNQKYFAVTSGVSSTTGPSHLVGTAAAGGIDWTAISKSSVYENYGKLKADYRLGISDPIAREQKADDSFVIEVKDGVAYVNGYRTQIKGTSSKVVDKARTYAEEFNAQIIAPNPITVYATNIFGGGSVTAVNGLPDIRTLSTFDIYNKSNGAGTIVGTCRIKSIDAIARGTFSDETFKVAIFDIKMIAGKGFVYNAISLKSAQCVINLSRRDIPLSGTHSASASDTVYGVMSNYDGELRTGSYVTLGGNASNRSGVLYIVSEIVSDVEIKLTTLDGVAANITTSTAKLYNSVVAFKPGAVSFITQLPRTYVKTLRSVDVNGDTNTTYKVTKQITRTTNAFGEITYVCPPGERLRDTDHKMALSGSASTIIDISSSWISTDGSTLSIPASASLGASTTYNIHLKVSKSGVAAAERLKVMKSKAVYIFDDGVYLSSSKTNKITWFTNDKANSFGNLTTINIGYADVIRINSIRQSSSPSVWQNSDLAPAVNVLSQYTFDNGQRPEFYDYATIKAKTVAATAPLEVSFDYFDHTSGDYFTVDSYQNTPYALIPTVRIDGYDYNLRDCIDFRIRVNDSNNDSDFVYVGDAMETNESFNFDYSYYLGRKDLLLLSQTGELKYIFGTPSLTPTYPVNTMTDMLIAKINVNPYTYNAEKEVSITVVGSVGYTMSDIEKLDNRVKNVETYVSLTLLEKQTANMAITDKYGLDRIKNGFYIANFTSAGSHGIFGAVNLPDYKCTIVPEYRMCVANRFSTDLPVLIDNYAKDAASTTVDSVGTTSDVMIYPNNIATIKHATEVVFTTNGVPATDGVTPLFSTRINVNPFNVFAYAGKASIHPAVDYWQSTQYVDPITQYMDETGYITSDLGVAKSRYASAWANRVVTPAELKTFVATGNTFKFSATQYQQDRGGDMRIVKVDYHAEETVNDVNRVDQLANAFANTSAWQVRPGDWNATVDASTIRVNNVVETRSQIVGQEVSKYLRRRTMSLVVRDLIPNIKHNVYFDNYLCRSSEPAKALIHSPVKFSVTNVTVETAKTLKFYDEYSLYSSTSNASDVFGGSTLNAWRSFISVSGKEYDYAVNGQLMRVHHDGVFHHGLLAGWEKTGPTSYDLYIFPTDDGNIGTLPPNTSVTIDLLNETLASTPATSSFVGTSVDRPAAGTTTNLGNLFTLIVISDDYFTTGEKSVRVERNTEMTTPTVAPGNYYDIINTGASGVSTLSQSLVIGKADDSGAECFYSGSGSVQSLRETRVFSLTGNLNVTTTQTVWVDPLAQSFMIKKSSTVDSDFVMVSGVNIWFAAKSSIDSNKCSVDIIESVNGQPTTNLVMPWATVTLSPSDIEIASVDNQWKPTKCTFKSPVPIRTNTEYCIRVVAPTSNQYEVWTSKMGEECVNKPGTVITAQQSDGSLFTSQNASTWTADQYSDMAVQLLLYTYPTNKSTATQLRTGFGTGGSIGYNGLVAKHLYVPSDDTTRQSEFSILPRQIFGSNGTNIVKVYHPMHPFFKAIKGKFFVVLRTNNTTKDTVSTAISSFISDKAFLVENVKPNSYTINLANAYTYNTATKKYDVADITSSLGTILTSYNGRWGNACWDIEAAGKFDMFRLNANFILAPESTTTEFTKRMTYADAAGIHIEPTYEAFDVGADIQNEKQFVSFLRGELNTNVVGVDRDYTIGSIESMHGINFRMHLSTKNKWITPILELESLSMSIGRSLQIPIDISDAEVGTADFTPIIVNESCVFSGTPANNDVNVQIPPSPNWITSFSVGGVVNISIPTSTVSITAATSTGVAPFTATFTIAGHGFNINDLVSISGITGSTIANGYVRPIDSTNDGDYFTVTAKTTDTITVAVSGNVGTASLSTAQCVRKSANAGVYEITDIDLNARKLYINGVAAPETIQSSIGFSTEYTAESNSTGGTSLSKFITREVILATPATSLHVTADMATPLGTNIELWYRSGSESLKQVDWVKADMDLMVTNNSISLYENVIEINNIQEFTRFQCKFVMSSNTHYNASLSDIRIIALA